VTAENKFELINHRKLLYSKEVAAAILTVMLFASFALHQRQSLAQDQPQQQTLANRTAINIQEPVEGLSFEIDNATFSHHTADVNGIRMHFVIGGQGDPVVL
jgi:hypothetical protein